MTELLVVIGIIALLAGILLVAMAGVRTKAKYTQTLSTMQEFAKACEAFQLDQGQYPGVIPDPVLAQEAAGSVFLLSGTENALIHLMGGYQVSTPYGEDGAEASTPWACNEQERVVCTDFADPSWQLRVNTNRMGEGPVINGKPHAPYYTPTESSVEVSRQSLQILGNIKLPELVDAWGQPIIYARRSRSVGPLVGTAASDPPPQFYYETMKPYLESVELGRMGRNQLAVVPTYGYLGSALTTVGAPEEMCAQLIRHQGFGEPADALNGTARGGFVLISAGPDGIYYSAADGPGELASPIGDDPAYDDFLDFGPAVFDDFDDLRVFGGG